MLRLSRVIFFLMTQDHIDCFINYRNTHIAVEQFGEL